MASKRIGWYNKNRTGNTAKHESHRHALASRGIKTALPKGSKCATVCGGISTPNFDMVKKGKSKFLQLGQKVRLLSPKPLIGLEGIIRGISPLDRRYRIQTPKGVIISTLRNIEKTDMVIADGIDFPMDEFHKGLKVETEHRKTVNEDPITIGRIALDHLDEDKEYYRKLAIMEKNVKNSQYDMSAGDIGDDFFKGISKGKAGNLKIVDKPDKTQLVGYNWAVYGERDKKTGKVTFYKGWDGYSISTSKQLTTTGLRSRADKVIDKRKEVSYDMTLSSIVKSLKKVSKGVSKTAHTISKNIEKHNIERKINAQKKLDHDIEVAKQQLKLKKMQAKSDVLEMKHKDSVQRQRPELARINKELEKGTTKAKAKDLTRKAGKEGLKFAGMLAKGVATEVREIISTEPPKKKKR